MVHLYYFKPLLISVLAITIADINSIVGLIAISGSAFFAWYKVYNEYKKRKGEN